MGSRVTEFPTPEFLASDLGCNLDLASALLRDPECNRVHLVFSNGKRMPFSRSLLKHASSVLLDIIDSCSSNNSNAPPVDLPMPDDDLAIWLVVARQLYPIFPKKFEWVGSVCPSYLSCAPLGVIPSLKVEGEMSGLTCLHV